MKTQTPFKRLILRAVLRKVSPMVIRVLAVPDYLDLASFDEIFRTLLDWDGLGFSFQIHGQEFTSFLRRTKTQRKTLREFQLRPGETFLYTCGGMDLWEWELRLLASETGSDGDEVPVCLAGRGGSPPEYCGGPTGYRLMLKRQKEGDAMGKPAQIEAVIAMLTAARPDQPPSSWDLLREVMDDGLESIDRRLELYGPLEPDRFSLKEANQRLGKRMERGRYRA
ncbi:MAG: IS1096 element passenger TnpR family protein [Candidatus Acidiferrales bacterium]